MQIWNFSFTCEHHYKLFINTFFKYSFCHSACKAEKTVHRWIFNHNAKQRLFLSSINLLFLRQDCQDLIYLDLSRAHLLIKYNNSFICICSHFKTTKFDALLSRGSMLRSPLVCSLILLRTNPPAPTLNIADNQGVSGLLWTSVSVWTFLLFSSKLTHTTAVIAFAQIQNCQWSV